MPRSITTFANSFGAWSWDTGATVAIVFPDGIRIESFAAFLRQMNQQRDLHQRLELPYTITQELLPQGGATPCP